MVLLFWETPMQSPDPDDLNAHPNTHLPMLLQVAKAAETKTHSKPAVRPVSFLFI